MQSCGTDLLSKKYSEQPMNVVTSSSSASVRYVLNMENTVCSSDSDKMWSKITLQKFEFVKKIFAEN